MIVGSIAVPSLRASKVRLGPLDMSADWRMQSARFVMDLLTKISC